MMVLGIEGSRQPAGVSLLRVDEEEGTVEVAALAAVEKGTSLSGSLLTAAEALLEHAHSSLDDVGALCVGTGPGSWTSLRITLSLAKTLAQVREIDLAGVPSFDALAQAAYRALAESDDSHRLMVVAGECRPGEVYAKLFEVSEDYLVAAQDEWIGAPREVIDAGWTQALSRGIEAPPLVVCAEGDSALEAMRTAYQEANEEASFVTVDSVAAALEIAVAGLERLSSGEADDALSLTPLYLAPSSAERVRFGL